MNSYYKLTSRIPLEGFLNFERFDVVLWYVMYNCSRRELDVITHRVAKASANNNTGYDTVDAFAFNLVIELVLGHVITFQVGRMNT